MQTYNIYYNGWEENQTATVIAKTESDAIHQVLTADGAPWASVIEIEQL